jgi:hypothetical protein
MADAAGSVVVGKNASVDVGLATVVCSETDTLGSVVVEPAVVDTLPSLDGRQQQPETTTNKDNNKKSLTIKH